MINFPIKKTINKNMSNQKNVRKANLGMFLEDMLNETNEYYLNANIAVIHKKPTPIQIVKVDFPNREHAKITEAYYKVPSTTDYNGIYQGKYVDFEAKECNSATSFVLKNVHPHQVLHLENIIKHGGIGFLIIYFKKHNEVYLVPFDFFNQYWLNKETSRKSIPYQDIKDNCHPIKLGFKPKIDYLDVVKKLYF